VEVAFDAVSGAHLDYLHTDLFPTLDRFAEQGIVSPGYISLRFTRRSAGLLAMQQWDITCSIEVAFLHGVKGNPRILEELQDSAVRRGGTVHWGQRNSLDRAQVAKAFPTLTAWRDQLATVLGDDGREPFDSDYCRSRGLEPP
jgi:hypothetical protein